MINTLLNGQPTITLEQAQSLIPDKASLYKALCYNQYKLPPLKDSLVTIKYLLGVKDGYFFCPKISMDLKIRVCADPPSRKVLAFILADAMANY